MGIEPPGGAVVAYLLFSRMANLTREQYNGLLFAFLRVQKGT